MVKTEVHLSTGGMSSYAETRPSLQVRESGSLSPVELKISFS